MTPQAPATYALLLHASQSCRLQIGRLGEMQVQPGYYIYMGSAFGPGGLSGRLSHHFKTPPAPHWHIDYLRGVAEVIEVWAAEGPEKREHAWALALASCPACSLPLPRFGASDCRCPAHLFFLATRPAMEWFSALMSSWRKTLIKPAAGEIMHAPAFCRDHPGEDAGGSILRLNLLYSRLETDPPAPAPGGRKSSFMG